MAPYDPNNPTYGPESTTVTDPVFGGPAEQYPGNGDYKVLEAEGRRPYAISDTAETMLAAGTLSKEKAKSMIEDGWSKGQKAPMVVSSA